MEVSKTGIDLIKSFEGFRKDAYLDIVGVPTIGYGTIRYQNGSVVKLCDTITEENASKELMAYVNTFIIPTLSKSVTVSLNQNQIDACASFIYNLGSGAFNKSTLLKLINAKDFAGASREFHFWNKAGGKEVSGLTRRRKAEMDLFVK